ncbi:MAG: phage late control D family protein [Trinickia sp.]|jgi:phage protein D
MSEPAVSSGSYRLLRNGSPFDHYVESIRVTHELSAPAMFEFVLPVQSIREPWIGMELKSVKPGDQISISLGRRLPEPIVTGDVTMLWPQLDASRGAMSKIMVAGFDCMERLRFGTHTRTFEKYTDNSIMRSVAEQAGIGLIRIEGVAGKPIPYVLQDDESDYEFLGRRCAQRNYEMLVDGTTLVLRPSVEGLDAIKPLRYYEDFDKANLRLTVPRRGSSVSVHGYDLRSGESFEGKAQTSNLRQRMDGEQTGYDLAANVLPRSPVSLQRSDIASHDMAQEVADAQRARGISSFISGTIHLCPGDDSLTAGKNVDLVGMGGVFDGLYYISKSVHTYERGEYETELEVRRSGI